MRCGDALPGRPCAQTAGGTPRPRLGTAVVAVAGIVGRSRSRTHELLAEAERHL
jgi:hypothetical protein